MRGGEVGLGWMWGGSIGGWEHEGLCTVHVCVYTQHAKIPPADKSYPGTCNARLRRKFHILLYHRTSISSLVLDGFQNSYNCCCYKWVESMWKWRPAGVVFFSLSSPHVWHHGPLVFFLCTPTDNATPPSGALASVTSPSLTGKRFRPVSARGQLVQVVRPDSEVMRETLIWRKAAIKNDVLVTCSVDLLNECTSVRNSSRCFVALEQQSKPFRVLFDANFFKPFFLFSTPKGILYSICLRWVQLFGKAPGQILIQ